MFPYQSATPETGYYPYNWGELGDSNPLLQEYVPPYLRTAATNTLPGADVVLRASASIFNTAAAMAWDLDIVPVDDKPQEPSADAPNNTPVKPTNFGGKKHQKRILHLRNKTTAQATTSRGKKGQESAPEDEKKKETRHTAENPAWALAAIFRRCRYQKAYTGQDLLKVNAPLHPDAFGSNMPPQSPAEPPPSPADASFGSLLSMMCDDGSAQRAASDVNWLHVGADEFKYTHTPHRVGVNLRSLPVVSQELPASDNRGKFFMIHKRDIINKVHEILKQYGCPDDLCVQLCGRKRALYLMERPIPTILITMKPDDVSPDTLYLALHQIVIDAREQFRLRDIAVEVIHPALEDPAEHPVPARDPDPDPKYRNRALDWRCGSRIAPPLGLLEELLALNMYCWNSYTWELLYVPQSV